MEAPIQQPLPQKTSRIPVIAGIVILVLIFIGVFWGIQAFLSRGAVERTQDVSVTEEPIVTVFPDHAPEDADRDGITDEEEKKLGTRSDDFDTDGDGISDNTEITILNTDPNNADTDGDGFTDGYELLKGYNPNGEG